MLNLLEAAFLDQLAHGQERQAQKAFLLGKKVVTNEDGSTTVTATAPAPEASYSDEDGNALMPFPGLRERPVGAGI